MERLHLTMLIPKHV